MGCSLSQHWKEHTGHSHGPWKGGCHERRNIGAIEEAVEGIAQRVSVREGANSLPAEPCCQ